MAKPVADDYSEIARRIREIREAEKPAPVDDGGRADEPAKEPDLLGDWDDHLIAGSFWLGAGMVEL